MKKLLFATIALVLAYVATEPFRERSTDVVERPAAPSARTRPETEAPAPDSGPSAEQAFTDQRSNVQMEVRGVVSKILKDDNDGARHQRFIVELDSGLTVLVAHNIDLAPRVEGLAAGDPVTIYGEYEWNSKGGVIHWTHHDPQGRHPEGWIRHGGRQYR